jgi:dipeptidyl aminopeptidase/acylaminoacyl peptidase
MLCEMTSRRRVIAGVAAAGLVPLLAPCVSRAQQPYTEISYQSSGLRIQGYFYQPAGSGPFPTLIYNHGSRDGFERRSIPWVRLAGLYVAAGYAVLVSERRGYGRSDGRGRNARPRRGCRFQFRPAVR